MEKISLPDPRYDTLTDYLPGIRHFYVEVKSVEILLHISHHLEEI